jgi:LPXTG-motif cell wall-anchored protein
MTMFAALRSARVIVVTAVVAGATVTLLVAAATAGWAQIRAPGGITVFDETGCVGSGNAAKVDVPFSIGITGLEPFATDAVMFVTDKDASPQIMYGPISIDLVDGQGNACIDVFRAPPGLWKVDVLEQGNGFTDSKVFTIVGPLASTTTSEPPTIPSTTTSTTSTTVPPSTSTTEEEHGTSTTTSTSTSVPPSTSTTTVGPGTSTTSSTSTSVPSRTSTTTPGTISRPGSDLPWTLQSVDPSALDTRSLSPAAGTSALPRTGAGQTTPIVAATAVLVLAGTALLLGTRRR